MPIKKLICILALFISSFVYSKEYVIGFGSCIDQDLPQPIWSAIEAKNVESFESFVEKRSKVKPNLKNWTNKKQVAFITTTGKTLDLTHGGRHLIDGPPVDYNYDLYEGPGISAPLNTGRMKFENEYHSIKLDFGVDLNEPLMPMRVIG